MIPHHDLLSGPGSSFGIERHGGQPILKSVGGYGHQRAILGKQLGCKMDEHDEADAPQQEDGLLELPVGCQLPTLSRLTWEAFERPFSKLQDFRTQPDF